MEREGYLPCTEDPATETHPEPCGCNPRPVP